MLARTVAPKLAARDVPAAESIVNTQDIFHGALLPAALFLLLNLCVAWATGRCAPASGPAERPAAGEWAAAIATAVFVIGQLTGVAAGYFHAVEAAAMGGWRCFCTAA
jgi:hypothetical protein